ncbi:MAG TPA: DUF4258 domain-containing protein [Polyangia bacterium]|jgi:hypothetical protein|nr:DUF4258 domain-containing protein [Polyangia bacterium]
MKWPIWWNWELELTFHVERRMEDRGFTEVDLRAMLETASSWQPDHVEGRFIILCRLRGRRWHVIIEPDEAQRVLVIITAYCTGEPA